jgi:hypothetical protein
VFTGPRGMMPAMLGLPSRGRFIVGVVLTTLVLAAPAAGAAARTVSRAQATQIALRALRREPSPDSVVFGLPAPLAGGTTVTDSGPDPSDHTKWIRRGSALISVTPAPGPLRHGAWLFWQDRVPGGFFEHPSHLVLVDMRTGQVIAHRNYNWWPLINGRRPAFLRSLAAYASRRYRVYVTPGAAADAAGDGATVSPAHPSTARIQLTASARTAGSGSCLITVVDSSLPEFKQSTALVQQQLAPLFGRNYVTGSPQGLVAALDAAQRSGCTNATIYILAHGYVGPGEANWIDPESSPTAQIQLKVTPKGGQVQVQHLDAGGLKGIMESHPGVDFNVVIFSCYGGRWGRDLQGTPNLTTVVTAAGPTQTTLFDSPFAPAPFTRQFVPGVTGLIKAGQPPTQALRGAGSTLPPEDNFPGLPFLAHYTEPQVYEYVDGKIISGQGSPASACRDFGNPAGYVTATLQGEFYPGAPQLGWASGTLTATSSAGGQPSTGGVGYDSTSIDYLGPYPCGSTLTLRATPGMGDHFDGYSSPPGGPCAGSNPTCTVVFTPTSTHPINDSLDVNFAITVHQLTINNTNPDAGVVSAGGNQVVKLIKCGTNYNGPTVSKYTACSSLAREPNQAADYVSIQIQPNTSPDPDYGTGAYNVASVTGCDHLLNNQTSATCQVAMTSDKTVTVSWSALP